jgi:uroporphyrinogen-III decarboxylase
LQFIFVYFQLLQIFESNAEYLGPNTFKEFALPALKDICFKVKSKLQEQKLEAVPMVRFSYTDLMLMVSTVTK